MKNSNTSRRGRYIIAATILTFALYAVPGHASSIAINSFFSGGFGTGSAVFVTEGFRFQVNQDIFVDELGFFDRGSNGLLRSYSMGIVDVSSNVLGTATVPSGTAGRLDGPTVTGGLLDGSGFRYAALDGGPLHLAPGSTYAVVVITTPGQPDEIPLSPAITVDSAITFLGTFANCCSHPGAGILSYPTQFATGDFPVNFTFRPVPVPAALPLFAGALGLMTWLGRREKRVCV